MSSALKTDRSDQSLDLGGLGVGLGFRVLGALNFTANDKLADIIFLGEVEESADLGSSLGTETTGEDVVGQSGDVMIALLDDDEGQGGDIGGDDASADGFTFALTDPTGAEARVTLAEQKANSLGCQDTLFHGETLLVVSSGDSESVALELISEGISFNILTHPFFVEDSGPTLVIDLDTLLLTGGWVGDVELHGGRLFVAFTFGGKRVKCLSAMELNPGERSEEHTSELQSR